MIRLLKTSYILQKKNIKNKRKYLDELQENNLIKNN